MRQLTWLLAILCTPTFAFAEDAKKDRPNFLIILCDDLGYGDLACYGNKTIRTPNLDKLASEGMRFTDCYSSSPVCSPSRAGLLTGRNPNRTGVYSWIAANNPMHLPSGEITIATLLRMVGYHTAHVGKWHLNGHFNSKLHPQAGDHGFEHWFGTQNNASPSHENPRNFVRNGEAVGLQKGFSCQIVADEAIDWLGKQRKNSADEPFFLFVCFHEPHEPVASPTDLVKSYPGAKNENQAQYFANVTNMDRAVGKLMKALDDLKLDDNTVVFFTSDNGPETLLRYRGAARSYGSSGPLRSKKLSLFEGGFRVPGILRWPGKTRPGKTRSGQTSQVPISSVDLLPTICKAAGARVPADRAIDGTDISPILEGKQLDRKTPLFWYYYRALDEPRAAMRMGDWVVLAHCDKLPRGAGGTLQPGDMAMIKNAKLTTFELYNLRTDLGQNKDLAKKEPQRLLEMSQRLQTLYREMLAEGPTWKMPAGKKGGKKGAKE